MGRMGLVQVKRELTDSSLCMRRMASAIRLATDSTLSEPSSACAFARSGMLLVVITSLMHDLFRRSQAGSERIGWVAQASTSFAPAFITTFAASVIVPAVAI